MLRPPNIETLLIATHNQGKLKEIIEFVGSDIKVVSASHFNLPEAEEKGSSFEENAYIKAQEASKATNLISLADDSGLCVDALNGDPGIYSARWAGPKKDFSQAMDKIEALLKETSNKTACFICTLCLCYPDGTHYFFTGKVDGTLSWPARGKNGFGYDPIFIPNGYDKTFAEMSSDAKHLLSHRYKAFEKLKQFFNQAA